MYSRESELVGALSPVNHRGLHIRAKAYCSELVGALSPVNHRGLHIRAKAYCSELVGALSPVNHRGLLQGYSRETEALPQYCFVLKVGMRKPRTNID